MSDMPAAATLSTPETVATQLAGKGAILTLNGQTFLVGHLVWMRMDRIFVFAANGNDLKRDGHLVMFDVAKMEKPFEVTFWRKSRPVARLRSLDASGRADAPDFLAAWRVWQQRRPLCQQLIGASLNYHAAAVGRR
jgi:hypothetical protein